EMNKRNIKSLSIVLIVLFTFNTFGLILKNYQIPNTTSKNSKNSSDKDTFNEDTTNEDPINKDLPKTADLLEEQQKLNYSFNTYIDEVWSSSYYLRDQNSTLPNDSTTPMILPDTKGTTLTFTMLLQNITNTTSGKFILPSDLHYMNLYYFNLSLEMENISTIEDYLMVNPYFFNGTITDTVNINETSDAEFVILNDWAENTNVTYHAYWIYQANWSYSFETKFIPTPENTQSDIITWDLHYVGHQSGDYDAELEITELENFTIRRALGYDGSYWRPMNYTTDATHIYLNESYLE
ncbi:unnamed protein product, partial [marine sediment metagenome]